MNVRRQSGTALLAASILALTAVASRAAEPGGTILQSCWNPAQLTGHPAERVAHLQPQPVPLPPIKASATPSAIFGNVRRVKLPPGRKLVALTFDMCESLGEIAGYDAGVIDYLRANQVKATLFVGGKWMIHHGERAEQLLADPLFEVGTHGWSHANLHLMSGPAVDEEIFGAVTAYADTRRDLSAMACTKGSGDLARIPAAPKLFRFPFGTCNPEALASVAASGQLAIQWDVLTGDPDKHVTAEGMARAVLAETRPGSIIVAHANGRGWHTADGLPLFIPQLKARGFQFVTVSELLAAGTPEIASTCYERHPGDNARYDVAAKLHKDASHPEGAEQHSPLPAPHWPVHIEKWP